MIVPRWRIVLLVTPYAVLAVLMMCTVAFNLDRPSHLVTELVLCVVAAAWVLVWRDLPTPWRGRPGAIATLMVGLVALNLALVLLDSWFGFLCLATFTVAYTIVWPWQLPAVAATAVVAGLAQSYGAWSGSWGSLVALAIILFNVIVMCGLAWGLELAQQALERQATQAERSRLAREIHDTLAQGFAGIVTQLQAAEQACDESERTRHTDAALALARDGLAEARRSVQALRPAALDAVRLPDALRNAARTWSARTGIPVDVRISGDALTLRTDAEVALLRTAQEALANTEKHADARRVTMTLRAGAAGCSLEVRDDGRGFDAAEHMVRPRHPESDGYGLVAMRERIEAVAGSFDVESRPGSGTAVRAEVPA